MHFGNWYCRECGWFPDIETWKGPLPTQYVKHDCMPVTDELDRLQAENARLREALERIDNECSRDNTMAWKIASDALEGLK